MKKLNVLSLFDGMSGAQIALDNLGIECNYYASEVDKYATKVTQANYPDTVQLGDVKDVRGADLPKIDLLIGGSPCQDLSVAKSGREGLDGAKSGLFWEYVRLLKECNPKYFLLENVASMRKADKDIISETLGCEPIMINSALVTAQSRKRLYWHNLGHIDQPADRHIYLKDIIEDGCVAREKSYCIISSMHKENVKSMVQRNKVGLLVFKGCAKRTRCGGKKLEVRKDEKANCLTTVQTDSMVLDPIKVGHHGQDKRQDRVYCVQGKSVTLCGNGGGQGAKTGLYYTPEGVRELTPLECERLQGVPEGHTAHVSNTQRYKMLGNGFNIPTIEHLLINIKKHV